MKLLAPAKINLGLSIEKKLADGYHQVSLVNCQVSLFDEIRLKTNSQAKIPFGQKNTVVKALKLLGKDFNVQINKNIPAGSGLGGGSSDAAQVLRQFNRLDLAPKIGMDVAYAGLGGVKLEKQGSVKGSRFTVLPDLPDCYLVVCIPKKQLKTKLAYQQIDKMKLKKTTLELLVRSIKNSNLPEIAKNLTNDFSSLAKRVCLEIEVIQKRLLDSGALGVSISGKGPAVFGIFKTKHSAAKATLSLQRQYPQTYLVQPLKDVYVYQG